MTSVHQTVGARLRELRELRRVSRDELAAALDTTAAEIAAFEEGAHIPAPCLMRISASLSVTVQALFIGSAEQRVDRTDPVAAPSAMEGYDLVKAFVRIKDARLRAALVEIADYMGEPENG